MIVGIPNKGLYSSSLPDASRRTETDLGKQEL